MSSVSQSTEAYHSFGEGEGKSLSNRMFVLRESDDSSELHRPPIMADEKPWRLAEADDLLKNSGKLTSLQMTSTYSNPATVFNASSAITSGNSYWIQYPAPGTMTGRM